MGRLDHHAEDDQVVGDPHQVDDGAFQARGDAQEQAHHPHDRRHHQQPHGQELGPDETPGEAAGDLPGLGRDDEAQAAAEEHIADSGGARPDPQGEQGQAVLLAAPGLDSVADHQEQQLGGEQVRNQVLDQPPAEAVHRPDPEEQVEHRGGQVHHRGEPGEVTPHGGEVHEPLPDAQTPLGQGVLLEEHLQGAL